MCVKIQNWAYQKFIVYNEYFSSDYCLKNEQ